MTEQIYASNTPTIDIHIVMGTGSPTDPHIDASIPLDTKSSEFVRFRATEADKEIMATEVINLLKRWAGKKDD